MNSRGFTLIELLVVIAIIGILAGVVITSLDSAQERAQRTSTVATMKSVIPELATCRVAGGTTTAMTVASGNKVCNDRTGFNLTWPPLANGWSFETNSTGSIYAGTFEYNATKEGQQTIICKMRGANCD